MPQNLTFITPTTDQRRARIDLSYAFFEGRFGRMIAAWTACGICSLEFADNEAETLAAIRKHFPLASLSPTPLPFSADALCYAENEAAKFPLPLLLYGTPFQRRVWQALCNIPAGTSLSYGTFATQLGIPKSVRAVASAIAKNPIALLIPCHRVVPAAGGTGAYRWGDARKAEIIAWERHLTDGIL